MFRIGCLTIAVRSAVSSAFGQRAVGEKLVAGEAEVVWGNLLGVDDWLVRR